jgi:murein DD-endopeptidase MepM/ murein hydrolase activator NlpD
MPELTMYTPSTVILDDDRDADVSWAHHEARYPGQTNRGGVDVVAPVSTPVHAWADGTVRNLANQGSAGNVAHLDIANAPGWSMEAKHLSRFAVPHGTFVAQGTVIGYSGTSGGVAPHVHYNLLDPSGIRRNPWHYVQGAGAASQQEEDDMSAEGERLIIAKLTNIENILAVDPIEVTTSNGKKITVAGVRGVIQQALATTTNVEAIIAVDPAERGGLRATLRQLADG